MAQNQGTKVPWNFRSRGRKFHPMELSSPFLWSQKCPHHHPELKIPWLTSFQPHTVIIICTHSSQELFMNGISCHNLLFYFVLLSHSGVHCHLSDMDPGTLCSEWESRPIPEEPKVHFYFNRLHRHWFYPGQTEHTADRAYPTQVLESSSLHWILKKKS